MLAPAFRWGYHSKSLVYKKPPETDTSGGASDIVFLVVQSTQGDIKFVLIDAGQFPETWSAITHSGDTWTNSDTSINVETWTNITHSGDTWTDVDTSTNVETWTETVN